MAVGLGSSEALDIFWNHGLPPSILLQPQFLQHRYGLDFQIFLYIHGAFPLLQQLGIPWEKFIATAQILQINLRSHMPESMYEWISTTIFQWKSFLLINITNGYKN